MKKVIIVELKDTVQFMLSIDYKDRIYAEYWQTKIRYDKLTNTLSKYAEGTLEIRPICPIRMLRRKKEAMAELLKVLEFIAGLESVDLYNKRGNYEKQFNNIKKK